ncbi:MAG: hypothetical protein QM756_34710 [Polyangiaceae bacterium]
MPTLTGCSGEGESPAGSNGGSSSQSNGGQANTAGGNSTSAGGASTSAGGAGNNGGSTNGGAANPGAGGNAGNANGGTAGVAGAVSGNGGGGGLTSAGGQDSAGGASTSAGGQTSAGGGGGVSSSGGAGGATSSGGQSSGGSAGSGGTKAGTVATVGQAIPQLPAPGTSGPVLKVDFDVAGRQSTEVTEPGYTAWVVADGASATTTLQSVKFTVAKAGSNGTGLTTTWQKLAVNAPNYARLAGDGVIVEGGDAGGQIQLTISGLSAGKHSLLTFHNVTSNVASAAPVDVLVNGTVVASKVPQTVMALSNWTGSTSFVEFTATAGQNVVILYRADTSSTAVNKNVMLNGFELDTPNRAMQATNPSPGDGDEHAAADTGSLTLSWKAGSKAVSHDVYFGEDPAAVAKATTASPEFKGNQAGVSYALSGLYSIKRYYWRIDELDSAKAVTRGNTWYFRPRQVAFPGAEGYGRFAIGGRGGVVVHVTNLNDSGAGSFRDAIETDRGPRTIVFDVSGMIALASRLTLTQPYVTVAGQTAPGKGICLRAAPFGLSGARDATVRNMRVRVGHGTTYDGMGLTGADHAIIDHSSISWTIDEAFSSRNGKNITLQRTLISECLNIAGHQNYPAGTAHGYAASIGGDIGSFHHNLLAHCEGRNWSLAGGLDGAGNFAGRLDIFNNVVYNWDGRTTDGGAHEVNFVSNYYKPGKASSIFTALNAQYDNFPGTQQYFMSGNVMPGYFDENSQDKGRTVSGTPGNYATWVTKAWFPSYATTHSALDAYKTVLSDVGMTQPVLDDHDVRVVKETLNGTTTYKGSVSGIAGLPDSETDVGGYESYPNGTREATWDGDADGLPNWWENLFKLNVSSAKGDFSDANIDTDGDGYTQLDEYLAWMAAPHYFTSVGKTVSIDLGAAFVGYTQTPTYTSSNVVNGSVAISGKTATFTPTKCGLASWTVKVSDSQGATMSKNMVAYVDNGSGACP